MTFEETGALSTEKNVSHVERHTAPFSLSSPCSGGGEREREREGGGGRRERERNGGEGGSVAPTTLLERLKPDPFISK